MYTTYFGFQEPPFSLTPTARLFYTNPVYEAAYAKLLEGIRKRQGFMVLTGEVGTGKTTLLHRLMNTLDADPTVSVLFSYYSTLSFAELFRFICEGFGLAGIEEGDSQAHHAFSDFLLARSHAGATTALLLDEAQDLEEDVLENLLLLSHRHPGGEKLLQIILVGQQPELEEKLRQPRLSQLQCSIALWCQLAHLKTDEVHAFIQHRLRLVEYERQDLFHPKAIQLIALYSQGIPRLINLLCDNALRATCEASQQTVSPAVIQQVAGHLRLTEDGAIVRVETDGGETLVRSEEEVRSPQLAVRPSQWTPQRPDGGRKRIVVTSSQPRRGGFVRRASRTLAWNGGAGVLLVLLGLTVFTVKVVTLEQVQRLFEPQVLVESGTQLQDHSPLPRVEQPDTLTKSYASVSSLPPLNLSENQTVRQGKTILANLVGKYGLRPMVWGLATANPALALLIPETEWRKLSREEQVSLTLSLEGLIPTVRAHPDQYIEEFHAAPLYETFRTKIASLCGDCWVIGLGHLTANNTNVLFDKVIVQGDSLWEKALPDSRGVKASAFRAALRASQIKPLERKAGQG